MMLVEETQVPDAALPIEALTRHLRLGSGFAEDDGKMLCWPRSYARQWPQSKREQAKR